MKKTIKFLLVLLSCIVLAGCGENSGDDAGNPDIKTDFAGSMENTSGNSTAGNDKIIHYTITFQQQYGMIIAPGIFPVGTEFVQAVGFRIKATFKIGKFSVQIPIVTVQFDPAFFPGKTFFPDQHKRAGSNTGSPLSDG